MKQDRQDQYFQPYEYAKTSLEIVVKVCFNWFITPKID